MKKIHQQVKSDKRYKIPGADILFGQCPPLTDQRFINLTKNTNDTKNS